MLYVMCLQHPYFDLDMIDALRKRENQRYHSEMGMTLSLPCERKGPKSALSFALCCRTEETSKDAVWKRQQMLTPLAELLSYRQKC